MANFCEECPLRGKCAGKIEGLVKTVTSSFSAEAGATAYNVGAFEDVKGFKSDFIKVPFDMPDAALVDAVGDCEYPIFQNEGFIRKRVVVSCRALGEYALTDEKAAENAKILLSMRK
ncbi:MAG: hypothetical protein ACHQT9_02730 [Candidatus Saccharimonadales bacterium]